MRLSLATAMLLASGFCSAYAAKQGPMHVILACRQSVSNGHLQITDPLPKHARYRVARFTPRTKPHGGWVTGRCDIIITSGASH